MIDKEKLIQSLKDLPEKFSMDELLDRLVLVQKVEAGLAQSEANQTFTEQEARTKLDKWLK